MTPEQLIPRLEGLVGHMLGSASGEGSAANQGHETITTWVNMVKVLLRSPSFRYLDDLEFNCVDDVVDVGIPVSADATHFIAALWEIYLELGGDTSAYVGFTDAATDTIDLGATLVTQEDVIAVLRVNDLINTGISEFYPMILPCGAAGTEGDRVTTPVYSTAGIALTTGLTAWIDGADGTAPAAATARVWTIYRT